MKTDISHGEDSGEEPRRAPRSHRVLVVEDERAQREALAQYLDSRGYQVEAVATGEEAVEHLRRRPYGVLITDLRLPGMDGLAVLEQAQQIDPELGALLITAYASVESAVEALRLSAHDYLLKPLVLEDVDRKVRHLLEHQELVRENARLRRALQTLDRKTEVVASSPAMQKAMEWVRRAAASEANVLLTGETGTGKEVLARAIHDLSPRSDEPFLAVNLAALPETMAESELFGHEKGAFTGAEHKREGLLRAAGSGTVFLDEIAELDGAIQAKLLRALEERQIRPVGSDQAVPYRARLLAATHRDLEEQIEKGTFREDLYYRLNVIRIHVPPLRERPEDIPPLVHHLLERQVRLSGTAPPVVSAPAMRALCNHPWRGNVRELRNVLERAVILADEGRIEPDHLPADILDTDASSLELQEAVDRFERNHIAMVLRLHDGNREKTAEALGISPATLYRRLEKLGLKGYEVS